MRKKCVRCKKEVEVITLFATDEEKEVKQIICKRCKVVLVEGIKRFKPQIQYEEVDIHNVICKCGEAKYFADYNPDHKNFFIEGNIVKYCPCCGKKLNVKTITEKREIKGLTDGSS